MTDRYKNECAFMKVRPIAKLLEQLEVSSSGWLLGLWCQKFIGPGLLFLDTQRLDDPSTPIDTLDLKG